jgi:hypothetical protein
MPSNYVLLRKVTLTATGTSSITFSNIPQSGYTDLKLVISNRNDRTSAINDSVRLNFNGVSTGYSARRLYGTGAAVGSDTYDTIADNATTSTTNVFSNIEYYIPNYLGSNNKIYSGDGVMENNATTAYQMVIANLWSNTAAIHTIEVKEDTGTNFIAGSEISLYGIAAVGTTPTLAPFATGGDIVANDGTYWYHAFLSSGLFTPGKTLTCDALVVAGGGSAGPYVGGGGGAGGLLQFTSQNITATNVAVVTVGAGGGTWQYPMTGRNGNNSQFGSLTAAVGGGYGSSGGGHDAASGIGNGGSGGGGGAGGQTSGGTGTAGQGNAGGNSAGPSGNYGSGGGGGAGAAGSNGGSVGGAGGVGLTSTLINAMGAATKTGQLSGGNYYFAGGGGGAVGNTSSPGAGGLGGGGTGQQVNNAGAQVTGGTNGTANTGGGAGGGNAATNNSLTANTGGSGIVIIRYPMA